MGYVGKRQTGFLASGGGRHRKPGVISSLLAPYRYKPRHTAKASNGSTGMARVSVASVRTSGLYQSKAYRSQPRKPYIKGMFSGPIRLPRFLDWT